ncbi:hypothetical protein [Chitinophaga sp.]|uniref:hypothetical protein n=1 Tax=Chitinophaga sp. TaxID=1869181 RepID=UPI002F9507C5
MAFLIDGINFTGSLGKLSAYRMKGSGKIVVRTKGGASGDQIRHSPKFERTRENNSEFSGCGYAAKTIRQVLIPVKHLADYNFTPVLVKLAKSIQVLDTTGDRGKRSILLSRHNYLLEGFQLNRKNTFDSVLRHPVQCIIERETGTAAVELPALMPGLNLLLPWQYPFFRFIITFGTVPDIEFNGINYRNAGKQLLPASAYTEWQLVRKSFEAQRLVLSLPELALINDASTLLVGIGIEMGMPVSDQLIDRVRYAGCGKILAAG